MTTEETLKQINAAARAEGADPEAIAEKAGYVPQPPNPDSPAASFLAGIASSAGAGYTHTFANGEKARFEFPRGVQAFQDLGKRIKETTEGAGMIEAGVLLIAETSANPKISTAEAEWLAENAGLEFVNLATRLAEAFGAAIAREPVRMVDQGKGPLTATS